MFIQYGNISEDLILVGLGLILIAAGIVIIGLAILILRDIRRYK